MVYEHWKDKKKDGVDRKKSWWQRTKFGDGSQGMPINVEVFNPAFLGGFFTWNEIAFLLTLSFVAWKNSDFRIRAAAPFLEEGLDQRGLASSGSIKRFKKKWIDAGFLRRVTYDPVHGNEYIVSSLMLPTYVARDLHHYNEARALTTAGKAKVGRLQAALEANRRREEEELQKKRDLCNREYLAAVKEAVKNGAAEPDPRPFLRKHGLPDPAASSPQTQALF